MEDKKKKKQEEKKKKEGSQKKAAEQKTKVPDPGSTSTSLPVPPAAAASLIDGKRPTPIAPQPAAQRYPPREVPPRFRQHEHKQLLKRGQPLPTGALPILTSQHGALSLPASSEASQNLPGQLHAGGWGDLPAVSPKPEPLWGEPGSPSPAVDNGTSTWGKPPGGCVGWGDGGPEPPGPYGRGNALSGPGSCKAAPQSMQDGGGGTGEELGMPTGQWEADNGDVWNSPASQESSSCSSWGKPPNKGPQKGKVPTKQDDAWILNRLIKQLTDMGFPRDPAEEALKSNNMNLDHAMKVIGCS